MYRIFGIIYEKFGALCQDFVSENLNNRNVPAAMIARKRREIHSFEEQGTLNKGRNRNGWSSKEIIGNVDGK
jgi:hypothetical protein